MDNCEHILESTPIFTDWLARSPHLKLLCTSRVPLDLYGEQVWPVAPLAMPDLAQPADIERWGETPAMRLLLARVQAADPAVRLTADNLLPLATLCVALDGLPLALELAAVRLHDLSPDAAVQQLLALRGLGQLSSSWLQQSKRNVAERHRTVQAAIDWSVRMLPAAQQEAFARLGVFAGGCSTDAAQAVACADPALLAALAHANLAAFDGDRATMLETLRAYAREQLVANGQLDACQQRHAAYFAAFAQGVFAGLTGEDQSRWMQRALADHNNLLAALRWALAEEDGEIAISLAGSLWWFWYRRGLFALGQEFLQAALQLTTSDLSARARALNGLASFHLANDEYAASLACHQEGLALSRTLADALGSATTLHNMGLTAYMMGDCAQAIDWLHASIDADPTSDPAQAWAHIGIVALDMQDLAQARRWLERAHQQALLQPGGWMQAFVEHNLADVLYDQGELVAARQMAHASLQLFEALGDSYYLPDPQLLLARIALEEGECDVAEALAAMALAQYENRTDAVLTSSARLVQAEIAWRSGPAWCGFGAIPGSPHPAPDIPSPDAAPRARPLRRAYLCGVGIAATPDYFRAPTTPADSSAQRASVEAYRAQSQNQQTGESAGPFQWSHATCRDYGTGGWGNQRLGHPPFACSEYLEHVGRLSRCRTAPASRPGSARHGRDGWRRRPPWAGTSPGGRRPSGLPRRSRRRTRSPGDSRSGRRAGTSGSATTLTTNSGSPTTAACGRHFVQLELADELHDLVGPEAIDQHEWVRSGEIP